jgi:hypothetical protein
MGGEGHNCLKKLFERTFQGPHPKVLFAVTPKNRKSWATTVFKPLFAILDRTDWAPGYRLILPHRLLEWIFNIDPRSIDQSLRLILDNFIGFFT